MQITKPYTVFAIYTDEATAVKAFKRQLYQRRSPGSENSDTIG
jgi:hypothetical protein